MKPLVTIGVPVYNGAKFIRDALDSACTQSYENLEIIVSDNASTDGTWEIVQDYARRDARFRCYRNPENIGIFANFQRPIDLADGKYFMWLAHDDLCAPTLIEKMVKEMEANSELVLCASDIKVIDNEGNFLYEQKLSEIYLDRKWQAARREFFKYPQTTSFMAIYGLYRTSVLKLLGSIKPLWRGRTLGGEAIYIAQFATAGRVQAVPESLKIARLNKGSVSQREVSGEGIIEYMVRSLKVRAFLTAVAARAKLPLKEKLELIGAVMLYNAKSVSYTFPRNVLGTLKHRLLKTGEAR